MFVSVFRLNANSGQINFFSNKSVPFFCAFLFPCGPVIMSKASGFNHLLAGGNRK